VGLPATLSSIRQLDDLPGLAAALGCEPRWDPAPEDSRTAEGLGRVALVGQAGALPWYGVEAEDPARAARRLARRLETWGRPAGVVALAPTARRLAVAAAFGDVPCIELSLDEPSRLALGCLERLRAAPTGSAIAVAAHAADALAGIAVGPRFFRDFRATLNRMASALARACPAADRHGLALLQLTRVLFLYLVQSKGWLDGRADFLARQVDRCLTARRHLHRDLLRPLFFGTLNRPTEERSRLARAFGRIPFLNGGLFEPHPLERRWPAALPNEVWRGAFDDLFERYRFVADERGQPDGIAPDMLGHVFEGVMEPESRRASGTFYTPAALVRQMIRAGVIALAAERLQWSDARAERGLDARHPAVRGALRGIAVLDPAVGSGAFLIGALDLLAALHAGERRPWRARRHILTRSLFGVDLNPAAVRLTELRLWLAVIADDPADAPEQVEPLPNLDCLIRQGDSLLDPSAAWAGAAAGPAAPDMTIARALARTRRDFVGAVGREKRALARALRRAEGRAFASALSSAEARVTARIEACLAEARGLTLFGERRGLDAALGRELSEARRQRGAIRAAHRRFRTDGELPWFHYESQFADVCARGGFDLVVGNPPWVRAERVPEEYRARLAARYRWWRPGVSRGFANRPDLSLAFLERSWELLRPGGALTLLLPAKLATAAYGVHARHALAGAATLHVLADLSGSPAADFDATVYPLAVVATRSAPPHDHRVRTALAVRERAAIPQASLTSGAPWVLHRSASAELRAELGRHPPLRDRFSCHLGVKTGANDLFLAPPEPLEPELLRWAVRGRDVRPFAVRPTARLLWPCDEAGRPLDELPPLARSYLARHRARLRARADWSGGVEWELFRTAAAAAEHRVVWVDLGRRLAAVPLVGERMRDHVPLNTCYVAVAPRAEAALRLAAWLNSTWVRAVARLAAMPASGGFARFNAAVVGGLPLPHAALDDHRLDELARQALSGRSVQAEIDAAVLAHLDLSADARTALAHLAGVRADDRR
jgi:hypothetical protein